MSEFNKFIMTIGEIIARNSRVIIFISLLAIFLMYGAQPHTIMQYALFTVLVAFHTMVSILIGVTDEEDE